VGCAASRHFRNKRREYLKDKINEPPKKGNNRNIKRPVYTNTNIT
jgi:hypothetical protein